MTVIGLCQIYFLWQYLCGKDYHWSHYCYVTQKAGQWSTVQAWQLTCICLLLPCPVAKITRLSLQNPLSNHNSHPYNHLHLVHMFILWCWTMVGLCQCLKQRESRLTIYHRVQTTNIVLRWYPIRSWLLRSYKNIETKTSHYKLYCYMFL